MQLRVHDAISTVDEAAWDALLDEHATPFVRWAWLEALESSGCASPDTGWTPAHLTLWRDERLIAATPAYLKGDSDGDFSRDWGWASAAERAGIPYYPKLVITVPFTPVTGSRMLIARGEDRETCMRGLIAGARELGAHSVHVLFPHEHEADTLAKIGLTKRVSFQYHWLNDGYGSYSNFLARFDSKRRNQIKREQAAPAVQGIQIRTLRGEEARAHAVDAFELHKNTVDKLMWGRRWLNMAFYQRVFDRLTPSIELVEARRAGKLVAGAFNVATATHLYGRYWGCFEEHKFLHFNVCLYHSIEECIRRGVKVFEGGAGGEHKLMRGFEPAETFSSHLFNDPRLQKPLASYIEREAEERAFSLERWRTTSPILKRMTRLDAGSE